MSLIDDIGHVDLVGHGNEFGKTSQIIIARTPTTCFAPALAANILRIPVPHPTSSTVFPLKRCELLTMAARYDPVRTESFSISS